MEGKVTSFLPAKNRAAESLIKLITP